MMARICESKPPLVSIITPHKDRIKYLNECIQSILDQNYSYIEHIIIDGNSSDGSVELLEKYRDLHPDRIHYISEPDAGAGQAWNKGLKLASGEIFGWLGSDDMLYEKNAVSIVVQFFLSHPDAKFVHGSCNFISGAGELLFQHKAREVNVEKLINETNPIACSSAFYRREVVETIGLLNDYGSDLDYMIRIVKKFHMYYIDDILSNFRIHKGSATTGNLKTYLEGIKKDHHVLRKYGGRLFSRRARRYYMLTILHKLGFLFVVSFIWKFKRMTKKN